VFTVAAGKSLLGLTRLEPGACACPQTIDADVLVGHNISAFDLSVLLHRLQVGGRGALPKPLPAHALILAALACWPASCLASGVSSCMARPA
jgi:hypothetical protein